jgi:hypothetical protein
VEPLRELALLDALRISFSAINRENLNLSLRAPIFALADQQPAGSWDAANRMIRFSRAFVATAGWGQVTEVLRHEMAHQYVSEVLRRDHEPPHGEAFAYAARRLGITARASGPLLGLDDEVEPQELRRIRKLLALANSGNAHEAEVAMAAARRLMRKRQIELVEAEADRPYLAVQVGRTAARFHAWETQLVALLTKHFHVKGLIVPTFDIADGAWKRGLEVYGSPENVKFACYVYDFVAQAAERLYRQQKAELAGQANARAQFARGVVLGFWRKLDEAEEQDRQTGLIWLGDPDLDERFHQRHPRLSAYRTEARTSDAVRAGFAAGKDLTLNRPITEGPSGEARAITDRRR